jgi:dienelactone hydrolase
MKVTAYTRVGDFGQEAVRFSLTLPNPAPMLRPEDFLLEGAYTDISGACPAQGVMGVETEGQTLALAVQSFRYCSKFRVVGIGAAEGISFSKEEVTTIYTQTADDFEPHTQEGVTYRLYRPKAATPRPLVLYLHGGGECGTDNFQQMTGTMGAANIAERWPDAYVLAPQAPEGGETWDQLVQRMSKAGNLFAVNIGGPTGSGAGERGWNREYLTGVCGIIRKLISDGLVDAKRVYAIGLSMGGAGVIRALAVDPELFAAAAPICPSMNGETYPMLAKLPPLPIWVSAAYIDHQPNRLAYLLKACQERWARGVPGTRLTVYTPEELAAYGIGNRVSLTMPQVMAENHNCWTLAFHNEYGLLDWLMSHIRDGGKA